MPLLTQVAARGYLVVGVEQPLDLGFTAIGAPDAVAAAHPEVAHRAVGGHSLGGVAASSYADIDASRCDLPGGTASTAVDGGVHAFFGDYGEQPGDGTPTTGRATAQAAIVAASSTLLASLTAGATRWDR